MKTHKGQLPLYTTKDGSSICELMHPLQQAKQGNQNQSLAEATIYPGENTQLHRHHSSEELYHVTEGYGLMTLGDQCFQIEPGDTVCIPPGTAHKVENTGKTDLIILCCCSPAYSHDDTEIIPQS